MAQQNVDSPIKVRKVTDLHANWNDEGELTDGKFSFQLILDNGAEERLIMPTNEDADVLTDLFELSRDIYFDTERRALIFNSVALGAK